MLIARLLSRSTLVGTMAGSACCRFGCSCSAASALDDYFGRPGETLRRACASRSPCSIFMGIGGPMILLGRRSYRDYEGFPLGAVLAGLSHCLLVLRINAIGLLLGWMTDVSRAGRKQRAGKRMTRSALTDANVLVVGGAGFVGSNLLLQLLEDEPKNVYVVDNLLSSEIENVPEHSKFHVVLGSIADDRILRGLPDDLDYVFHLACYHGNQSSIADPIADHANNTITSLKLFDRLKDIPRLEEGRLRSRRLRGCREDLRRCDPHCRGRACFAVS